MCDGQGVSESVVIDIVDVECYSLDLLDGCRHWGYNGHNDVGKAKC